MAVAEPRDVGSEQSAAARHIQQEGAGALRAGDEPGASCRDPVEHRKAAAGGPPLAGEVVVLLRVVARANWWHRASLPCDARVALIGSTRSYADRRYSKTETGIRICA